MARVRFEGSFPRVGKSRPGERRAPLSVVIVVTGAELSSGRKRGLAARGGFARNSRVAQSSDVREVLQYIPQFRGKVFLVLIEAGILPEPAVAETLLDLAVLEDLGVKLVLGVLGGDLKDLYDWTLECEIMAARVSKPIGDPSAVRETLDILARGQSAVVDASSTGPLDAAVVDFAMELGVAKVIALLEEAILIDGAPAHAIRAADAESLACSCGGAGAELLLAAAEACRRGVPRVHVLNGRRQGVLVDELFSNEGVGTMVHADSYRMIRPLREEDIPELLGMIGRSVRRTKLVERTYEDIQSRIGDFHVMTIDGNVVGCVALHEYPEEGTAEVACLYVKQAHEGRGYGAELVGHAEETATRRGIPRVFALSNRAADFFTGRLGYDPATVDALPAKRRAQYEASGRDSLVFSKPLNDPPT
jgi:amino-acid N-acetyltransferase